MSGKVYLVGAGPGDPDLLTLKALKVLKRADVVLHDDLIPRQILDLVPPTAQLRNVGKRCGQKNISQDEINALLVTFASFGLQVIRLKGGDPLIFGRGGEEIEALRKAKIDFEIVPGVTAALGAAAAAQIPLTQRKLSSAVVFLTAHQADTGYAKDWHQVISSGATLVIYMPGHHYDATSRSLLEAGLAATTPCAIISQATRPNQRIYQTTIGKLPTTARHASPTLLIIGEVAQLGVGDRDAGEEFEPRIHPYLGEPAIPLSEFFNEGSSGVSRWGETE
jgi:uroporphyrin-III C-methyltransferase